MFFSRYGRGVVVSANDGDQAARLRDHSVAYVYTFDAQGNQAEQLVGRQDPASAGAILPVTFAGSIRLEGYELANSTIEPGKPIVLLLYWSALEPVGKDYVVFVHLVDRQGATVAGHEKEPREGAAPTSAWIPGQRVVDAVTLSLPSKLEPGRLRTRGLALRSGGRVSAAAVGFERPEEWRSTGYRTVARRRVNVRSSTRRLRRSI